MHPKSVARAFRRLQNAAQTKHPGRPRMYTDDVVLALRDVWTFSGRCCAELLHPMIGRYVASLRLGRRWRHPDESTEKLLGISLGTCKRLIREFSSVQSSNVSTTSNSACAPKSGKRLSRAGWQYLSPGHSRVAVATQRNMIRQDEAIYLVSFVDAAVSWQVTCCQPACEPDSVYAMLDCVLASLPHQLIAVHFEKGCDTFCRVIEQWCRAHSLAFTCVTGSTRERRSVHARGEQVAHPSSCIAGRAAFSKAVGEFSEIAAISALFSNYFMATRRQISRETVGNRIVRRYERTAKTPYKRVVEHSATSDAKRKKLAE